MRSRGDRDQLAAPWRQLSPSSLKCESRKTKVHQSQTLSARLLTDEEIAVAVDVVAEPVKGPILYYIASHLDRWAPLVVLQPVHRVRNAMTASLTRLPTAALIERAELVHLVETHTAETDASVLDYGAAGRARYPRLSCR